MTSLTRIKKVTSFRSLQSWSQGAEARDFMKYNVVFGVNGSGKSTLASLLRNASRGVAPVGSYQLDVDDSGNQRSVQNETDPFWTCLRVFNADYVAENLKFADDLGGSAQPLLVLGEKRIGVEEARIRINTRLAEIAKEVSDCRKIASDATKARDKLLTDTARTISEELQGTLPRYASRSYRAPQVKELIQKGPSDTTNIDAAAELRAAQVQSLSEYPLPAKVDFGLDITTNAIRDLLKKTILSVPITDLVDHPDWSHWVDQGMGLHAGLTTCIYCQNVISDDRRSQLEAHFDKSLKELQLALDRMSESLQSTKAEATAAVDALISPDLVCEAVRAAYAHELALLKPDLKALVVLLDKLIAVIDRKRGSPFSPIAADNLDDASARLSLDGAAKELEKHNAFARDISKHRADAAVKVEHYRVNMIKDQVVDLDRKIAKADMSVEGLEKERIELDAEYKSLQEERLDPLPLAERLNEDLSQLLGREDLLFAADGDGYRIMRHEQPARHLSEGERNAISLLYFLTSLDGHDTDRQSSIVVIDDPVSSLDQNSLVGASSLLWSRLVGGCGQLVMLTHNYELFRTWSYQLETAKLGKKAYELYEIRPSVKIGSDGVIRRAPHLVSWPYDYQMQKRLRSEYHYLFWTVLRSFAENSASPSPEKEAEAAAILPNVCRRMLEAFLAFRYPSGVGSLWQQVRDVPAAIDKDVRVRVLRFAHTYSHNEEADISQPLGRPETYENVRAVLEFMRSVDQEHFDGMCEAVEIAYA